MTEKEGKGKKVNAGAVGLMIAAIVLIAAIVTLLVGADRGWWGDEADPVTKWRPKNPVLGVLFENPSGTFRAEMPAVPSVINVDYSGFPMINYFAMDGETKDGYTVSHVRDVKSIFGVDGRAFLIWVGEEFIKTLAEETNSGSEYMILRSEMLGEDRELEAQVYNKETDDYTRFRLIGRENQLMIVKAEGKIERVKNYEDFLKSFVWLSLENNDLPTSIMTREEIDNLDDGVEKPKAVLDEGLVLVRRGEAGEVVAVTEEDVLEGDIPIEIERI